jgi:hypothetical protein
VLRVGGGRKGTEALAKHFIYEAACLERAELAISGGIAESGMPDEHSDSELTRPCPSSCWRDAVPYRVTGVRRTINAEREIE